MRDMVIRVGSALSTAMAVLSCVLGAIAYTPPAGADTSIGLVACGNCDCSLLPSGTDCPNNEANDCPRLSCVCGGSGQCRAK